MILVTFHVVLKNKRQGLPISKDLFRGLILILSYSQSLSFAFQWMHIITLLIKNGHLVIQIFSPIARKLQGLHISKDLFRGYFLILSYSQSLSFAFQWMPIITNFKKIDQPVSTKKIETRKKDTLLNVKL